MESAILIITGLGCMLVLPVIYHLIVPEKLPDLEDYFKPGDSFSSEWEGFTQTVVRQEGERVYTELRLKPGAAGPPEHCHLSFDELITVQSGEVTVTVNGEVCKLKPGESLLIERGVYHRIYNEDDQEAVICSEGDDAWIPVSFAFALSQLYGFFDERRWNTRLPNILFQLSAFGDLFDSWLQKPSISVQRKIRRMLKPYARVMGYSIFRESRAPGRVMKLDTGNF